MWATAIALAYLEDTFKDKKNFWTLIKDKMIKFIARTLKPVKGVTAEAVIVKAAAVFK